MKDSHTPYIGLSPIGDAAAGHPGPFRGHASNGRQVDRSRQCKGDDCTNSTFLFCSDTIYSRKVPMRLSLSRSHRRLPLSVPIGFRRLLKRWASGDRHRPARRPASLLNLRHSLPGVSGSARGTGGC